ncbi:phage baseplate assembly protein V [Haliangium sp.]|uniref:phage baseplate assembly protein V n=1 Tax=Haliangium sp. TaxID=2663208 RepID=UPI003D0AE682
MTRFELDRIPHHAQRSDKLRGVYLAIVTANTKDGGDSAYQIKVKFPWLPGSDKDESYWARIAVPMAGPERGSYFLPEVDDQVLVVFEHGEVRRPIMIGALWSEKQKPPETNADGKNNFRIIKSRTGHRLVFDDTDGAERVILCDSTKKNKILLDSANKTVTIESADGDIEIKAKAGARLHGQNVNITTTDAIKGKGGIKLVISTKAAINVKADGELKLQSAMTKLNG